MGVGMVLSVVAMLVSGMAEQRRREPPSSQNMRRRRLTPLQRPGTVQLPSRLNTLPPPRGRGARGGGQDGQVEQRPDGGGYTSFSPFLRDSIRTCGLRGAAGPRWTAAYHRFDYAGAIAELHGLAARVNPAGLRQNPPRLHPYPKVRSGTYPTF